MKKIIYLLQFFYLLSGACFAQSKQTDSLSRLLKTLPSNAHRLDVLWELSTPKNGTPEVAIEYAHDGLELAGKLKLPKREEDFMYSLGVAYYLNHDYPKSIEMAFRGLELSDEIHDTEYHSTFLYGLSVCYADAGDLNSAITYSQKDVALLIKTKMHAKIGNQETISNLYGNIARYYMRLNRLDSALNYMQRSYNVGISVNYKGIGRTILGLGMIEDKLDHADIALSYYRLAMVKCSGFDEPSNIEAHQKLASLFKRTGKSDSAFYYAKQGYKLATDLKDVNSIYETSALLSSLYEGNNEMESLRFYKIAAIHKDSLNITEKTKEFEIITARERQRELEAEEEKLKEQQERKENLQLIALAIFIPAFLLLVLQLSKTRIPRRLVDFMGILSLLLLFEFITLLLHPWIGMVTHHTPVIELLILVVLSSILAPLHHSLNHWIKGIVAGSKHTNKINEDQHS